MGCNGHGEGLAGEFPTGQTLLGVALGQLGNSISAMRASVPVSGS